MVGLIDTEPPPSVNWFRRAVDCVKYHLLFDRVHAISNSDSCRAFEAIGDTQLMFNART